MSIGYARDGSGVVTLTLDLPGRVNTMGAAYRAAFGAALDRLAAEDGLTGVLVTSAKDTFFAGGDIDELYAAGPADLDRLRSEVREVKAQLRRLETLGVPVVACLAGSALGGGLELALACHHRVALSESAAPTLRVGLPEVTLGLLPGAGGCVRLVRMLGVAAALPLLSEGKRLKASAALAAGLVDEVVSSADELEAAARAWIAAHPDAAQPWDVRGHRIPGGTAQDPRTYQLLAAAPAVIHARTRATLPAPSVVLEVAVDSTLVDVDTAFEIETERFLELVVSPVAKNLISTFWYAKNAVDGGRSRPAGVARPSVSRLAVLGAGMMGAGIAQVAAQRGIDVVLKDVSASAAERGLATVTASLDALVAKGRLSAGDRDAALARVHPTADDADLAACDAVIEAVFEDRALKAAVLPAAEAAAAEGALVASNTSTLPISSLAAHVADPEGFVGIHFFSPVPRMPLVEVIRGERTSDETVARAYDLVRQLGKTPIVVGDGRGFFTSRVFGTYTTEGIAMLAEGVPAAVIENVARAAGFPVGPLAVADEVSLTLIQRIRRAELADAEVSGETVRDHPAYAVVEKLLAEDRAGKAAGAGFYDYPADGPKSLWGGLSGLAESSSEVPVEDVRDRLLLAPCLEAVRCVEAGVVRSADDANLGSVLGIGFPPWTGGVLRHLESTGLPASVERASELAARYGERFAPPALLRANADSGTSF